ncbi:hypothetical protein J5N97_013229 [Dioscorea zingiberensis]|uniref:NAC domain-containing protein n=1 Tax=Dioscorea zingiberensis TaxID=325984 RepID=A0A9D5CSZ9_9LILI|nr:hypothetical protein J5N97_013229 [Dioscorea zingiberensis]
MDLDRRRDLTGKGKGWLGRASPSFRGGGKRRGEEGGGGARGGADLVTTGTSPGRSHRRRSRAAQSGFAGAHGKKRRRGREGGVGIGLGREGREKTCAYSKERKNYYFMLAKRSSPGCSRLLRQTGSGYWHMNDMTKKIHDKHVLVDTITTLAYIYNQQGKKIKTKWVMHEYRVDASIFNTSQSQTTELVLCYTQESGRGATPNRHEELLTEERPRVLLPKKRQREDGDQPIYVEPLLKSVDAVQAKEREKITAETTEWLREQVPVETINDWIRELEN